MILKFIQLFNFDKYLYNNYANDKMKFLIIINLLFVSKLIWQRKYISRIQKCMFVMKKDEYPLQKVCYYFIAKLLYFLKSLDLNTYKCNI